MKNISDHTGGDLRERRLAARLPQLTVAQLADCSPAMVGLLERGYRPQRSAVLDRINQVLNEKSPGSSAQGSLTTAKGDGRAGDSSPTS